VPLILYIVMINLLARIGVGAVRKCRQPKRAPMCATCSFAHMQYANSRKRTISCTFAGGLRPITIDVMYCTDYSDRSKPARIPIVGFVSESPESQALAEVVAAER
jgi:hypothetical protein